MLGLLLGSHGERRVGTDIQAQVGTAPRSTMEGERSEGVQRVAPAAEAQRKGEKNPWIRSGGADF